MNQEYKYLLPGSFSKDSKVWVYQGSRVLTLSEALAAEDLINEFCERWQSHGAEVEAYGNLFFGQFLVLMADESRAGVSGCSTDSSVRFVKELEKKFGMDFFDRNNLAFIVKDKIQLIPLGQLNYAYENNFITADTLYFNNTVLNKEQLENDWIIPLRNSWLARRLKLPVNS
jgi:hypothetical protein